MTILLKLGGSLITDKTKPQSFRREVVAQIISEIKYLTQSNSQLKFILGHGSGSFGHVEAHKYNTVDGVNSPDQWLGFTKVSHAASKLSQLMWTEFLSQDLPVIRFQPSASLVVNNGLIESMNTASLKVALENNLIPLVHGDVAFDNVRGGTIVSTEAIFQYLVNYFNITKIILLGQVDGVFDSEKRIIANITPTSFKSIKNDLGGSHGVDVTGGMVQKVSDMLKIVEQKPTLQIVIANGKMPNILSRIIYKSGSIGTTVNSP